MYKRQQLGIIEIEGATPDQMTSFYSGMYRLFMYPNLLSEQTGEGSDGGWQYRSPYGSHEVEDGVMYYNNGFWAVSYTHLNCPGFLGDVDRQRHQQKQGENAQGQDQKDAAVK